MKNETLERNTYGYTTQELDDRAEASTVFLMSGDPLEVVEEQLATAARLGESVGIDNPDYQQAINRAIYYLSQALPKPKPEQGA